MIAYSLRKGVLLWPRPRTNGKRFTRRVWPPSNARWIWPPVRAFCPFVPRPAVLPRPEPCPRPTRLSALCEPGAGRKSESFTDDLLYLHQVNHLLDHTTHSRPVFVFNRLLQLAEAKCLDRSFLILWVANCALNIFYTQFCHYIFSYRRPPPPPRRSPRSPPPRRSPRSPRSPPPRRSPRSPELRRLDAARFSRASSSRAARAAAACSAALALAIAICSARFLPTTSATVLPRRAASTSGE